MNTLTITITGPVGSGKTRVAEAIAQSLADANLRGTIQDGGNAPADYASLANEEIVRLSDLATKTSFKVEVKQ